MYLYGQSKFVRLNLIKIKFIFLSTRFTSPSLAKIQKVMSDSEGPPPCKVPKITPSDSEELLLLKTDITNLVREKNAIMQEIKQGVPDTEKEQLLKQVTEKEKQITENKKQITHEKAKQLTAMNLESSRNKGVCEDVIKSCFEDLEQFFSTRPLLQLPNYEMLQKLYHHHHMVDKHGRYNSILISGPKGCGKTTSLYQLYLHLQSKNIKSLYIDLLPMTGILDGLLDVIREYNPDVLLIDNVQEFDSSISSRVVMVPFIVAALSPAGYRTDGFKSFVCSRRRCVLEITFSPLNLEWAKHFLTGYKVQVVNEPGEFEASELYSEFEQHDKTYYLDDFKKIKDNSNRNSQQATSNQESATSNQEEEEGSEHQISLTQTAISNQKVLKLTSTEFLKLFYETGGIPRYLYNYVLDSEHKEMYRELQKQVREANVKIGDEVVAQKILNIAVSGNASPMDDIVSFGIAYYDEATYKYHISSPYYVKMALQLKGLDMVSRDWHKLEELTLFFLRYHSCSVSNHKSIEYLPKSTKPIQKQIEIGVVPPDAKDGVTIIYLAAGHPVIDAILVDCVRKTLYFVQTSFLSYSKHKKKMEDVFHTAITRNNETSVYDHYISFYQGYHVIYVYATPQKDKSPNPYVYFMDLRHISAFNRW